MRTLSSSMARAATLGALALFASCSADDRGLTFELGTSMGSSTTGATGGISGAGGGGHSGKTGTSPHENAGENAGGSEASAGADNGGAGAASSAGTTNAGTTASSGGGDAGTTSAGNAGTASAGNAGTAGAGTTGGTTTGEGGAGGTPFDGPCGDLNRNLVDDCAETLVQNSRFETATIGWEPEGSLTQAWVATNAHADGSSGSLSLRNTTFMAGSPVIAAMGSRQCLLAWGEETYELAAKVFIQPGQGSGSAAIDLVFFGNDGCQGTILGGRTAARVEEVDAWRTARGQITMPAGTRSVWVRLTVGKPLAQASFEALFDDVLVSKK